MNAPAVPRILHQTWKTATVPDRWSAFAESWRAAHPGWQYYLWTDEANRAFVATHYPALLAAYDGFSYAIQRADAVRYCLLHHYGGVYVDLDMECLQPLDDLVQAGGFIGVYEPPRQVAWLGRTDLLSNAFLAAEPGHPFLASVIEWLAAGPARAITHVDVLATTGPVMLDRLFRQYTGSDVTVLPWHTFFPFVSDAPELAVLQAGDAEAGELKATLVRDGAFAVHYWANSWVDGLAGELVNPYPHNVAGYDYFPGLDSPGNDIANVGRDVRQAAEACSRIPGAVAFNTDGFVKDRLLPPEQWIKTRGDPGRTGLYVKRRHRGVLSRLLRRT